MSEFAKSLFNFSGFHKSFNNADAKSPTKASASSSTTAISNDTSSMSQPISSLNGSGTSTPNADIYDNKAPLLHNNMSSNPINTNGSDTSINHNSRFISNHSNNIQSTPMNVSTTPESLISMGKLKVKIIEAKGLNVISQMAHPYVVCTCDSNEFITPGPSIKPITTPMSNRQQDNGANSNGIAIPSRQSSNITFSSVISATNPQWKDEAVFDIISEQTNISINIYDANNGDMFLGQIEFAPDLRNNANIDKWYKLEHRVANTEQHHISGEIRVRTIYHSDAAQGHKQIMKPSDFEILSLVGKGTFGQVYQVRKKDTQRIYAMKVLSKKVIVQKKEIAHTIGERNILVRTSTADSPFIVGLKFSFQTETDLYLITDYMSGGELFWHLQKEGRFQEDRAKFYIAELILALEHLHNNDIVYRDLKPENILLDANGHIALCDFGLSKANLSSDGTTNTFCGTTEYLAPEVLLDEQGYTKMVDFWSLGVLIFEMCCGWSPFYAEDTQQMYKNIAFGKVRFPKDALSQEGRNFVKGLLNRNPKHRLGAIDDARELRQHAFFDDVNWEHLAQKKIVPPFKPHTTSELDTSNFDPEFTETSSSVLNQSFMPNIASTPLSPGIQANFQGFTYVGESIIEEHFKNNPNGNGMVGSLTSTSFGRFGASYRGRNMNLGMSGFANIDELEDEDDDGNTRHGRHHDNHRDSHHNNQDHDNDLDMDYDEDLNMDEDGDHFIDSQRFEI